ncbi:riboflavin kinase [Ignicoccus islandicus DSM 13165]|uniref:Riboflavin kinase n=1 Tax=Ignicoccus islandicus DSM 13165 TaxID=940295 RepID=A0A0U2VB33_9CREN|nr:DUF120 domain-containing protein [Ignicoccus islandicus]ALU11346.1 riboflavin kinase [Ignicoccus islandicus DSM 13165]
MDREKITLLGLLLYYLSNGNPCDLMNDISERLRKLGLIDENGISRIAEGLVKELLSKKVSLKGIVVSGSGEGRYFLSLEGYRSQIRNRLGFDPYPGTLNVLLDPESMERKFLLLTRPPIILKGFRKDDRTFGEVLAYPARINGLWPAALVIPLRTHHPPSIIEIISPYKLREKLELKNGDYVAIEIY